MARHDIQLHQVFVGLSEVRLGKRAVKFLSRETLALLACLAVEAGEQQREHLVALLWPEASPERSHASLRSTLGHLQVALRYVSGLAQTPCLATPYSALALNPEAGVDLDLQMVEQADTLARPDCAGRAVPDAAASQIVLQAAVAAYRCDFLAGFSLGAAGFDDG